MIDLQKDNEIWAVCSNIANQALFKLFVETFDINFDYNEYLF